MRFFDTDWNMILSWLGTWEKFSPAARRHYLEAKSHAQSVDPEGYGADLELALSLGLVERVSTGRARPTKASAPFRSLMVQLFKWPLFEGKPDRKQLEEYLHKHYISDEQRTLSPWKQPGWDSPQRSASFLDATKLSAWEGSLLTYHETNGERDFSRSWFRAPEITEAAKAMVKCALNSKRAWRLGDLAREVPERLRPHLDPALKACFRHALLFAALDPHSLDLLVGVCPFILHLANRPAPIPPAVEQCAGAHGLAFHVEDMTQLLTVAATNECFLNQGSYRRQFFKAVETRLREEFVPLPEWLIDQLEFHERLYYAAEGLESLRFVTDTYRKEGKRRLKATERGRKWLEQAPAARLREILFECQRLWKEEDWKDEEASQEGYLDYEDEFDDLEGPEDEDERDPACATGGKKLDLLHWQKSVWRQAPTEGCVALDAFLDYHARVSLPGSGEKAGPGSAAQDSLEEEEVCRARLRNFFFRVLAPFGCVEATQRDGGELWFRLSPAGQYLVGLKRSLQGGPEATAGTVVVQPNFDIVFLGPDLGAEVAFASFAERCGRNVGTLFRITRQKMILAASRGVQVETVLNTLAEHSSTPIPENVVAEIQAWFGTCRHLAVRHPTLISTEDAETALSVKQLLGPECTALSPTLLEWPEQDIPTKLIGKLRERGLFLGKGSHRRTV